MVSCCVATCDVTRRNNPNSATFHSQVGSCSLPLNPSTSEPPAMASAVSISSDTFSPSQGPNVKSYMLMLRVTVTRTSGNNANASGSSTEIMNGENEALPPPPPLPPRRRRRRVRRPVVGVPRARQPRAPGERRRAPRARR